MNNYSKQDIQKWFEKINLSDTTLNEISDSLNQLEFKTKFSSGYQEAHFYMNGLEFLSLSLKDNDKNFINNKLKEALRPKEEEIYSIIKKNENITFYPLYPFLYLSIFDNFLTSPITQSMLNELDNETQTRIISIYNKSGGRSISGKKFDLKDFFQAIHDNKTISPLLNHHDLQRINEFNLLAPYDLYLNKVEQGEDLNNLNDGELLKNLFDLEEIPTRKVINFIKQFKKNDLHLYSSYYNVKGFIQMLSKMNKEDYPQSFEQLLVLKTIFSYVETLTRKYIVPDETDTSSLNCLEMPYLKQSEYSNFDIDKLSYDLNLSTDYLIALYTIFPDYFERNNKIKLLHLVEDSKVWHDNIANINSKISAHILEHSNIPKPAEKISILDMFPFKTKQGLIVKPLLDSQSLVEEGNQMNHCVGGLDYYYSILKGESFLFHLENTITGQKSTLEIQYCSYSQDFSINQNYGYKNENVDNEDAKYVLKQIQCHVHPHIYQDFFNRACLKQEDVYQVEKLLSENKNNYQYIKEIYAPYPLTLFKKLGKWKEQQELKIGRKHE